MFFFWLIGQFIQFVFILYVVAAIIKVLPDIIDFLYSCVAGIIRLFRNIVTKIFKAVFYILTHPISCLKYIFVFIIDVLKGFWTKPFFYLVIPVIVNFLTKFFYYENEKLRLVIGCLMIPFMGYAIYLIHIEEKKKEIK